MSRYLVDSNVIVYPLDRRDPWKQARAREVLRRLEGTGSGALPAQALAELANVALRKLIPPVPPRLVLQQVESLTGAFPVHPLTAGVVREALRGVARWRLSYYDAQVWAVARIHSIAVVLSEDFTSGSTVDGVGFLNPFDPGLDPSAL